MLCWLSAMQVCVYVFVSRVRRIAASSLSCIASAVGDVASPNVQVAACASKCASAFHRVLQERVGCSRMRCTSPTQSVTTVSLQQRSFSSICLASSLVLLFALMECRRQHAFWISSLIACGVPCVPVCKPNTNYKWMLETPIPHLCSRSIHSWHQCSKKCTFLIPLRLQVLATHHLQRATHHLQLATLQLVDIHPHQGDETHFNMTCKFTNCKNQNQMICLSKRSQELDASGHGVLHQAKLDIHQEFLHSWPI